MTLEATKVSVIGLGYIGLPTATIIASRGHRVLGVDANPEVVELVGRGHVHIVEPELDALVNYVVASGYLRVASQPEPSDAFIIAVPTPLGEGNVPDMRHVKAAAHAISPVLRKNDLVILESTSPVGATETLCGWMREKRPDLRFPGEADEEEIDVHVAYCPERVLPGRTVHELVANDRIIGGMTNTCAEHACRVYRLFVNGELFIASARTAEMCKLAENAYRDVSVAYANELSMVCEKLGVDVAEVIQLANRHPRVEILRPGCGVGGHCIAVDPWFLVSSAPAETVLVQSARFVNERKAAWVLERIEQEVIHRSVSEVDVAGEPVVALYGMAFKPDIDDLRGSPALGIAKALRGRISNPILVVDPHIDHASFDEVGLELVGIDQALERAEVHAILVAHAAFRGSKRLMEVGIDFSGLKGYARENT